MNDNKENDSNGANKDLRCNVCLSKATKRCQKCQTRIYCGRGCQRADWDLHRRYCRPRRTNAERIHLIERECEDFGLPFSRIEAMAERAYDADSIEKAFESVLSRIVKTETGRDTDQDKWPVMDDSWQFNNVSVWDELRELPVNRNDEFSFSYMTVGTMDKDTGFLLWQLTAVSNTTGKVRFAGNAQPRNDTRPGRSELEQLIYLSMARPGPAAGPPGRPQYILFAHRWGKQCTLDLIDLLWDKLRIRARLESREEAKISAAVNGTDPEGFNFPKKK